MQYVYSKFIIWNNYSRITPVRMVYIAHQYALKCIWHTSAGCTPIKGALLFCITCILIIYSSSIFYALVWFMLFKHDKNSTWTLRYLNQRPLSAQHKTCSTCFSWLCCQKSYLQGSASQIEQWQTVSWGCLVPEGAWLSHSFKENSLSIVGGARARWNP
jgi:hypothetical protein